MISTRLTHGNKGKRLEVTILASQRGVVLTHVSQAARRIGGGGALRAIRGPVDYFGAYTADGRAILFDAKTCELAGRFPVGNRNHVPPHQVMELIRYGQVGAVAGLLVEATALGRFFWCDWRLLGVLRLPASYPWAKLADVGSTKLNVNFDAVREAAESIAREAADGNGWAPRNRLGDKPSDARSREEAP